MIIFFFSKLKIILINSLIILQWTFLDIELFKNKANSTLL